MKKTLIVIFAGATLATSAMGAPTQLTSKIFNFNPNPAKLEKSVAGFPQTLSANGGESSYALPKLSALPLTVTYILNAKGEGCAFTFEQGKNTRKSYDYEITAKGVGGFSDKLCQIDSTVLTINFN